MMLINLSAGSIIFPLLLGGFFLRRMPKILRFFWFYVLVGIVFEIATNYLSATGLKNVWLLHIYSVVEYGFLAELLGRWWSTLGQKLYRISIPAAALLMYITQAQLDSVNAFNPIAKVTLNLLLVIGSLLVLSRMLYSSDIVLHRSYKFWILCGMFLYFGGTSFVFLAGPLNLLVDRYQILWQIYSVDNILSNVIYGVSFLWGMKAT